MKIIAVNGRIGVGKTSLLNFFQEDGFSFIHAPIAGPLKDEVATKIGKSRNWVDENKNLVRPLLIAYAEFFRNQMEDYWIDKNIGFIEAYARIKPEATFYVDDVRYKNELARLKEVGATTVQLWCPAVDSIDYMISQGIHLTKAKEIAYAPTESELAFSENEFDIRISAPRTRPLADTYLELKEALYG